jgi:hypothetical protein
MRRPQVAPTDDWLQLQLLAKTPTQRAYELIRPVVLFGQPASVRARVTGVPGVPAIARPARSTGWAWPVLHHRHNRNAICGCPPRAPPGARYPR